MKLKKKLSQRQKDIILIVSGSFLSTMVLVCSLLALNILLTSENIAETHFKNYVFLMFLSMSVARIPMVFDRITKLNIIRNIIYAAIYFTFAVVSIFLNVSLIEYCIIGGVFSITIVANRIIKIIDDRSVRSIIINSILAVLALIMAAIFFFSIRSGMEVTALITLLLMVILSMALIEVLYFCFSRIKLKTMGKIIRKTFAVEVLYGLFILIIACSFVFYVFDAAIPTFEDALWYSFAVVTTIGFGDFTATSTLTRILSVILGMYGLIVVAVLTSIIVNFYNETNKRDDSEKDIADVIEEELDKEDKEDKKAKKGKK